MSKKYNIQRFLIIILILFLVFLYALGIILALKGNGEATISIVAYSTCFSVILFFLIKLHRYVVKEDDND